MLISYTKSLQHYRVSQHPWYPISDCSILHGVEARAKVVCSGEDVVRATSTIPKRVLSRDEVYGLLDEWSGVTNRWKAIDGAEIARNVDRDEEEVGLVGILCPYVSVEAEQRFVKSHLRSEEVVAASVVG